MFWTAFVFGLHGLVTSGLLVKAMRAPCADGNSTFMPSMIKPRTLGVLAKVERRKVGASYIVSALGLFDLARPDADRFETDQALWILSAKALPKGSVLDVGMPKPRAELLIGGAARAPAGQPTTALAVEWAVGPLRKRLIAFGDRYWAIAGGGLAATPPHPFVEVPLSPERAFGGPGFADNPSGLGYHAGERTRAGELVALPNIENADQLILSAESRPVPALCGPIDLASPKRRRYAGTYDGHWLKHVAPALPDDVDPRLFLTAPDDQVFPGYLAGGEPYALRGFSPDEPELRGTLPAFRVRCFIARKGQGEAPEELVEMEMRIDTLWLFAGARRGVLIYRGALPVSDIDAEDLSAVMLAYERASDEPRSIESYVEVWKLRRDRKSAHKYAFAEGQLAPALTPDTVARRDEKRRALAREMLDKHYAGMAWAQDRQLDKAGVPKVLRPAPPTGDAELDEALLSLPMPTPEEIEEGEIDLAALLDGVETLEKKVREKTEKLSAQAGAVRDAVAAVRSPGADAGSVDALFAALDDLTGGSTAVALDAGATRLNAPAPSSAADPNAGAEVEAAFGQAKNWRETLLRALGASEVDEEKEFEAARARLLDLPESRPLAAVRPGLEAVRTQELKCPDTGGAGGGAPAKPARGLDLEALLDGLDHAAASPVSAEAPTSKATSAKAQLARANAQLLTALPNLSKHEGSPLDALLAAIQGPAGAEAGAGGLADGTQSAAARMKEKLDEAASSLDAQEASLAEGLALMRRSLPDAAYPLRPMPPAVARRFGMLVISEHRGGLNLRGRDLAGADLRGADLAGADFEGALLERADFSGARLAGARLVDAALTSAILDGADLTGADLGGANLCKCRAHRTDFTRCRFAGQVLLEGDFTDSKFHGAQIERLQILKGAFDGADFSGARLSKTTFVQTSLKQTVWDAADLEAMPFMDLPLIGARFRGARLFRCIFLKVQASGSDFEGADITRSGFVGEVDLTGARFVDAVGADSTFHEVKLTSATFERGAFDRATFVKSDLTGASFRLAALKGALFGGAKLVGADFVGANLLKAQLRRADMSGARLIGANLYGADLDHAVLTAADLTGVNLVKTLLAVDSHAA
jgi:uncharacterized protein YjbI with pentapeptide repeats